MSAFTAGMLREEELSLFKPFSHMRSFADAQQEDQLFIGLALDGAGCGLIGGHFEDAACFLV